MSGTTADPRMAGARAVPKKALRVSWSDPRFRAIFWQIIIVGTVALIVWYLVGNTQPQPRRPSHRDRFCVPRAGRRHPDRRVADIVRSGDRYVRQGADHRHPEHAQGRRDRRCAGDHPRHAGRYRPAVQQLAAGEDHRRLCRDAARHSAAAAVAVLVRAAGRPARAAPGASHRQRDLPVQSRHPAAGADLGTGAHLGGARVPGRRGRHLAVEPPRAPAPGGNRAAACGLAGGAAAADWPPAGRVGRARRTGCGRGAGAARLQLPGRRHDHAGVLHVAGRPGALHRRLHRGDRAVRHPGGGARPVGGGRRAGSAPRRRCCAGSCCRRRCA